MAQPVDPERWSDVLKLLTRGGPFTSGAFNENDEASRSSFFNDVKVLVIGAGGLGCELLKDLALVGFRDIEVIDMDTIDYSNLNRQFLFRTDDVGHSKAERAAAFINRRIPGAKVIAHHGKIQDMSDEFYSKFHVIISGLDSITARRWMNEKIYQFAQKKMVDGKETDEWNEDTIFPFIDGGTEGFLGNVRFIYPHKTPCFDCVDLFPAQQHVYQMCTIVNTPRQPEHCIAWAKDKAWDDEAPFGRQKGKEGDPEHILPPAIRIDGDNPEHVQWCWAKAIQHAERFNIPIEKLTYKLTQGVVKNIIPAIAATNAIIAASCANEAFKVVTECSRNLNNYVYYFGNTGVGTNTQRLEKKEDCTVCNLKGFSFYIKKDATLSEFKDKLIADERFKGIKDPLLTRCDVKNFKTVICQAGRWAKSTIGNLVKPMASLIDEGDTITVIDANLTNGLILKVYWDLK